jgi:hypothetical protein
MDIGIALRDNLTASFLLVLTIARIFHGEA